MQDQSYIVKPVNLGAKTRRKCVFDDPPGLGVKVTVNSGKAKPVDFGSQMKKSASLKPMQEDGTTDKGSFGAKDGKMKVKH